MLITIKMLRAWEACWSDDKIKTTYRLHGLDAATPRQIAECEEVGSRNRVWVLCHTLDMIDSEALKRLALELDEEWYEAYTLMQEPGPRTAAVSAYMTIVRHLSGRHRHAVHSLDVVLYRQIIAELLAQIEAKEVTRTGGR